MTCMLAAVSLLLQIGCMGYNARPGPIALVIEAFKDGLKQQGRL